jgi:hypothetical protein
LKDFIIRNFLIYNEGDEVKEGEMDETYVSNILAGNPERKREHLQT